MKEFKIVPKIITLNLSKDLFSSFSFQKDDLIFISDNTMKKYFCNGFNDAIVVNYRQFGQGEPSDVFVNAIIDHIGDRQYNRIFAIGGGTILDVAKLFVLERITPIEDLFLRKFPAIKSKELILIPTTCGTGSEVTNISILELISLKTKLGLSDNALFADTAILIPELIKELPYSVFATSSIDALIHAFESYLSPSATSFTKLYAKEAIEIIVNGYCSVRDIGVNIISNLSSQFLLASTYAGISFGNAGCASVHALSYPLGATYHIAHGEANYVLFIEILNMYKKLKPMGEIENIFLILSKIFKCSVDDALFELEKLLTIIFPNKKLSNYGVKETDIEDFTNIVFEKQGRLMGNNYTELSKEIVFEIYSRCF